MIPQPAMVAGDAFAGSFCPVLGRVRDLSAVQAGYDSAQLGWRYEGFNPQSVRLVTRLDGSPAVIQMAAEAPPALASPAEGQHSLGVVALDAQAALPDLHGLDPLGQRAWVSWDPSTDADTVGYKLYWDAGADETPATLLATVTRGRVERRTLVKCDTGTGEGRYSVWGSFQTVAGGGMVNGSVLVEITASGQFSWALGALSGTGAFSAGQTFLLPNGARLMFHDNPASYETGDTLSFRVGPEPWYLTGVIGAGTYRFAASAVDAAGNESATGAERVVRVISVPPVVTGTLAYDAGTLTVGVAGNITLVDTVNVYANWSEVTDTFLTYVNEDAAVAVLNDDGPGAFESFVFTPGTAEGVLRFYLRPVKDGVELPDLTLYEFSFPPVPEDLGLVLGSPTGLAVAAAAAGDFAVSWNYRYRDGDDLDSFSVWIWTSEGAVDWTDTPAASVAASTGSGFPVAAFSYAADLSLSDGVERWFGVRAVASDGETDLNTVVVSAAAAASAPTAAGAALGAAQ